MNKNVESTRFYSDKHEKSICKALGGIQNINSGATKFSKSDVIIDRCSMLIEAKCVMSPKNSVSIKKEWLEKNVQECFAMRKDNTTLCFNFEPEGNNYYVINEKLMKFLVEKLSEEY